MISDSDNINFVHHLLDENSSTSYLSSIRDINFGQNNNCIRLMDSTNSDSMYLRYTHMYYENMDPYRDYYNPRHYYFNTTSRYKITIKLITDNILLQKLHSWFDERKVIIVDLNGRTDTCMIQTINSNFNTVHTVNTPYLDTEIMLYQV